MKGLNLAEWAIRHKQIVYFFIIAIITGGLWSYFHLGRSEDPDFTIRQAVVTAAWPGASAQQITQQVTDPLEKKLQDTKGLDYIKSFTHDGKTVIYVNLKDSVSKEEIQTRWHEIRNLVNDEWACRRESWGLILMTGSMMCTALFTPSRETDFLMKKNVNMRKISGGA